MSEDKAYFNEILEDAPFPGQDVPVVAQTQANPAGTYTPTTTPAKKFPVKRTAVELMSTALNTRSRKILESFDLEQRGAIQVGKYENGVSGDLRITPNGLTARDQAGITTFAIDGETGDAVFKGEIRSGSLITGGIITGEVNVNDAGSLRLNSGADIILDSIAGDQAQILFTHNNSDIIDLSIYYDSDTNLITFADQGSEVGFKFGSPTNRIQLFEIYGGDGLLVATYTAGGVESMKIELTTAQFLGSYQGSPRFKFDTSGNLFITGTITQNWIP